MHRASKTGSNTTTRQLALGLEPWGEYLPFPPGQTFEVVGEGDAVGELEVVEEGDLVIIYLWSGGSTLAVYCEGRLIHAVE